MSKPLKTHLHEKRNPAFTLCGIFRGYFIFAKDGEEPTCGHCLKKKRKT